MLKSNDNGGMQGFITYLFTRYPYVVNLFAWTQLVKSKGEIGVPKYKESPISLQKHDF